MRNGLSRNRAPAPQQPQPLPSLASTTIDSATCARSERSCRPRPAIRYQPGLLGRKIDSLGLTIEHKCSNLLGVTGTEFIRLVRRIGRKNGAEVRFDARRGKGSHGRLYYGDRFTTLKDRR